MQRTGGDPERRRVVPGAVRRPHQRWRQQALWGLRPGGAPGALGTAHGHHRRQILDRAGGLRQGRQLKAWLPGGASTGFLLPEHLDLPLDFDTVGKEGSRLGTGLLAIVPDSQSMVALMRNLEEFFARESCGWCTPCRDGLPWTVKLLRSLERGEGETGDIELLDKLAADYGPGLTFCAHAPGAAMPLQTALKHFHHDSRRASANRGQGPRSPHTCGPGMKATGMTERN